jgi:hypothetical protein
VIDYILVSTTTTATLDTDPSTSFDAAVRTAAELQTCRLREFGLHVEQPERDAYRRLIDRLSV